MPEARTEGRTTCIYLFISKSNSMKVQFWVEQGLLPYLLKDVPHTIIERSQTGLKIEIEANGVALINLVYAAKAYGGDIAIQIFTQTIAA